MNDAVNQKITEIEGDEGAEPVDLTQQLAGSAVENRRPSFQITSPNLQYWTDWMQAACENAKVELQGGMIYSHEIDPAHVCLVEATAPVIRQTNDATFGINLDSLSDFLRTIPIARGNPLNVQLRGHPGNNHPDNRLNKPGPQLRIHAGEYSYRHPLIDTSGIMDPKNLSFNKQNSFTIPAKDLSNVIKRAKKFSDQLRITSGPKGVTFLTEGAFDGQIVADFEPKRQSTPRQCSSVYSLNYLDTFRKRNSFQGDIKIRHKTDYPIEMIARPAETRLRMVLSPRTTDA